MKEQDEIDHLFQSSFDNFSVEPPPSAKVVIDERLRKNNRFKKRWILALLGVMAVVSIGFLIYPDGNDSKSKVLVENDTTTPTIPPLSSSEIPNSHPQKRTAAKHATSYDSTRTPRLVPSGSTNKNAIDLLSPQPKEGIRAGNPKVNHKKEALAIRTRKSTPTPFFSEQGHKQEISDPKQLKAKNENEEKKRSSEKESGRNPSVNKVPAEIYSEMNKSDSQVEEPNKTPINTSSTTKTTDVSGEILMTNSAEEESEGENSTETTEALPTLPSDTVPAELSPRGSLIPQQGPPLNNGSLWTISSHFGAARLYNQTSNSHFTVVENQAFYCNVEASYSFQGNWNLSGGFQFNRESAQLHFSTVSKDSIAVMDSILELPDSTFSFYTVYQPTETTVKQDQLYKVASFQIPLYFGYSFAITDSWKLDLNGGILLAYQSGKQINSDPLVPTPMLRSFGFKTSFRPQLRYQLTNQFGISLHSNFGYDLRPALNWTETKRTRMYSELGVGLHFRF
jgi:hypothetical protein